MKTFQDLENQFGDLVEAALKAVRYVTEAPSDMNVSRLPLHPLWLAVQKEAMEDLFEYRSGVVPEQIIEGEQRKIADNYSAQIVSLLPGGLIANGYAGEGGVGNVAKYLSAIEQIVRSQPDRFQRKMDAAKERLHFTAAKRPQ